MAYRTVVDSIFINGLVSRFAGFCVCVREQVRVAFQANEYTEMSDAVIVFCTSPSAALASLLAFFTQFTSVFVMYANSWK